ncbi:MAG: hypothetical protein QG567_2501 [Campylobacterota bacterium]|nr:hypothetical protein [Campylobacterota bacterium]
MITQGIIKKWITDTLKDSAEYQAFCIATIGSALNFYRSAPIDNSKYEALPFLTVYNDDYEKDDLSSSGWGETWIIPIAIAIQSSDDYITDATVKVWESTDKVELLAMKAKEILKKEANGCGIGGEDISVLKTSIAISEIGYSDDVQASMFIMFGKRDSL